MTPTTASSSVILLNPAAPTAKSTVAVDSGAAPTAAVSGFELLLGAMQQVKQTLPTSVDASASAAKNSDKTSADSGNPLPLLGSILPLAGLPQATADVDAKAAADNAKSKDKKDQDANAIAADLMSPIIALPSAPSGLVIQPPRPVASGSTGSAATPAAQADAVMSALAGVDAALAAQSGATKDAVTSAADNKDNKAVASISTGANALDTAATSADTAATTAALVKGVEGASKHVPDSDFDTLIKHFDAGSPPAPAGVNVGNSANAHQASRTYFDAANGTTSVSVPVGNSGWSDAVADKVMWFSANKISSAEIHLNPPDLGPLQVRVSTQHDQTSVIFTSQHAAVRDALDQALPRLRDMMGSQGMHQLDVSVGGQSAQQQQQQFNRNNPADRGGSGGGFFSDDTAETTVSSVTTINTARLMRSGVDAYA